MYLERYPTTSSIMDTGNRNARHLSYFSILFVGLIIIAGVQIVTFDGSQFLSIRDVDWATPSMVGNGKKSRDKKSEFGIHIIGERHTGTSWLQQYLEQCFGDQVRVYDRLSRHKYWFQFDDEGKDYGLVIATFRNVYEWIDAMRRQPLHAPIHYDLVNFLPMNITEFISTPWIPPAYVQEKETIYTFLNVTHGKSLFAETCYDSFTFFDVVPCSYQDRLRSASLVLFGGTILDGDSSAVYEMRKNHSKHGLDAYNNILSLRRDKMINFFQDVQKFSSIKHYIAVKFEDLVNVGTLSLVQEIEEQMNIKSRCDPMRLRSTSPKIFSGKYIQLLNDRVDWSIERMVGYDKLGVNTSFSSIEIVDEVSHLLNLSSVSPVEEASLSPPNDDPPFNDGKLNNHKYNATSNESHSILKSIHRQWHPQNRDQRFPSVNERIEVYMSNWYDPCLNASSLEMKIDYYEEHSSINGTFPIMTINLEAGNPFRFDSVMIFGQPIFIDRRTVEICASDNPSILLLFKQRTRRYSPNFHRYCEDIIELMNLYESIDYPNITSVPLILQLGDDLAQSRTVPIISKFRMNRLSGESLSRFRNKDSSCNKPYLDVVRRPVSNWGSFGDSYYWDAKPIFQPIIWNLNRMRHFGDELNETRFEDIPWENKLLGAMWVGNMNGGPEPFSIASDLSSLDVCLLNTRCRFAYQHRNSSLIHASLTSIFANLKAEDIDDTQTMLRADWVTKKELLKYKVVISLEGNDVSTSLKWNLLSNSVVMMPPPTATSWLMEELLIPWVHYIPLKRDGSNAEEMIRWVGQNDLKARRIAERGTLYIYDLLYHPDAKRDDELVKEEILRRYKRFWR